MKKFIVIFMIFFIICELFAIESVKAEDPAPQNSYTWSEGTNIHINYGDFQCPSASGWHCYPELYERDKLGIWHRVEERDKLGIWHPFKGNILKNQTYGLHQYTVRMVSTYNFTTSRYSDFTDILEAYVLHTPTGLRVSINPDLVTNEGLSVVALKWDYVDINSDNIQILRRKKGTYTYDLLAILESSALTYNDFTTLPDTTYEYSICVTRKDETNICDDISLSTNPVAILTLPIPPTNFTAYAIEKKVYMTWSPNEDCSGYKIYRYLKLPQSGNWIWSIVATLDRSIVSYHATVTDYGHYSYKISAYNSSGDSPNSPTFDIYALKKLTGLTSTALSSTSVKITYDSVDTNATNIAVSESIDGSIYFDLGSIPASSPYITISKLTPDTHYWFKMILTRESNSSAPSDPVSVKTLPMRIPPSPPSNLDATTSTNSTILTWSSSTQGTYPIAGYTIHRGTESGGENTIPIATVDASTTTYTDNDVTLSETYYYYVKTFDNQSPANYSSPSNEVSAKITDTTSPALSISSPSNYAAVKSSSITVTGKATDSGSGIDKVTINGSTVSLSSNGSFSKTVYLTEGTNTITIIATDKADNESTKAIIVTYTPPVQETVITLQPDNSYMLVNGVSQEIDLGRGTKPIIIPEWSRTIVPIRAIVEALGGTIEWEGVDRKVTINFKGTTIELWIDNPQAEVNSVTKWIDDNNHDVKPIIVNSRTMLPLRFVAESLGCDVGWDPDTRTITITYGG